MKPLAAGLAFAMALAANSLPVREGWTTWSPRSEIAPHTYIDELHGRNGRPALALSGVSNPAVYGGWQRVVERVEPGQWYRFRAAWRGEGLDYPAREVVTLLDWVDGSGKRTGQPDYPWSVTPDGEWSVVSLEVQAPPAATSAKLQLLLLNAPRATVWWDDVSFERISAPGPRKVSVTAVNLRPRSTQDPVAEFLAVLDHSLPAAADVALLPEGITVVGTGKTYAEVAEAVPGPTTERLGDFARRKHVWVVAGIYEKERQAIYNTAVLIDRSGRVAGRYRKVYIPREELEAGITPGSDYPVFRTDFGTVGLMICWDVQYADPARALALRGAEMILMPIWGGFEALAKARALENHVFLAASGYDHPTYVMDPNGDILARAQERGTVATATVDLNRRYLDPWLGDTRARFMKELRLDVPADTPGRR